MNIQRNELLMLNKFNRMGALRDEEQSPVTAPTETEQSADKGMNALSFKALKFKNNNASISKPVRNFLTVAAATALMGLTAASCADKITNEANIDARQEQQQQDNTELYAAISALLSELSGIRSDNNANAKLYTELLKDIQASLAGIGGDVNGISLTLDKIKANQDSYILLIKDHFKSEQEARAWFKQKVESIDQNVESIDGTAYKLADFLEEIRNLGVDVKDILTDWFAEYKKVSQKQEGFAFATMIYAQQTAMNTGATAYNTAITNAQLAKLNQSVDSMLVREPYYAAKLEDIEEAIINADENNQAGQKELLKEEHAQTLAMYEAIKQIKKFRQEFAKKAESDADYQAAALKYAKDVKNELKKLNFSVAGLVGIAIDTNKDIKDLKKNNKFYAEQIIQDLNYNNYYTKKLYQTSVQEAADIAIIKEAMLDIKPLIQNIDGTTTNIYDFLKEEGLSADQIEEFFKILNAHQEERNEKLIDANNTNKNEIINAINGLSNQLDIQGDYLNAIYELEVVIAEKEPGSSAATDLTEIEKRLAYMTKVLEELGAKITDYTPQLNELVKDVKKLLEKEITCNCTHEDYTGLLQVIIEKIEYINTHEGIQDQDMQDLLSMFNKAKEAAPDNDAIKRLDKMQNIIEKTFTA